LEANSARAVAAITAKHDASTKILELFMIGSPPVI
jgi:hypothetical protein